MKRTTAILYLALFVSPAMAQVQRTTNTPATDTTKRKGPAFDVKEKLVELAMKNPQLTAADAERNKAVAEMRKASSAWADYVTFSVNINEVSLKQYDVNQYGQIFFPLWNIGINIPLGSFVGKAQTVKSARSQVDFYAAKKEQVARNVRATVLIKYQDYLTKKQLLSLQSEITEDDYTAFTQAEQKFATGSITYDAYSQASKTYNNELTKRITLERDVQVAKYELEEIIGVKLDDVLAGKY